MPSPFPGMDPYIEATRQWRNFHSRYVPALAEALFVGLPDRYIVKVAEDVYLHELSADERRLIGRPDRERWSVVTVIELLSPTNKAVGSDRTAHLAKRQQWQEGPAHFVEVDLLRDGPRLPLDGLPTCDFYALVSRVEDRPRVGVWPIGLRDPLPIVPIPLTFGDADVPLDLRAAFNRVYDGAGYARYLYSYPLDPLLSPEDAAWAAGRVAAAVPR